MMFALNSIEKYVREKWDKIENINDKILIRYFLVDNLYQRLHFLNNNIISKKKQYLLSSINKLNFIVILIASKDWPKSWPSLINELCDRAKTDISYESENCIKVLLLLSEHLNKSYKKLMTSKKNIELTCQMYKELNKVFNLINYFIVEQSDEIINILLNENNININNSYAYKNNDLIKNILRQAIKLFDEFIKWFDIDNILDKKIIQKLLYIFQKGIYKNEIIECLGSLFKFEINKLEKENKESLRFIIFDIYESYINIFHNDIVKRKNFLEQYEYITNNEKEKIFGFEIFSTISENCLIFFFKENFDFIKEKSILSPEFLSKYNKSFLIGLQYLLQFSLFKNEQIQNTAMEFWYYVVFDLFTLKEFKNKSINSINSKNLNYSNNNINEKKEILVDYLKKSDIYNKCFSKILNNLRELLCQNMRKPSEIKIKLDENDDIISDPNENDTFNQNLQETKQNILIYLSLIEPEKTKNFIIKKMVEENKEDLSSINLNKINSLCWSSGIISGTMDEKLEGELVISLCKLLFIMLKKAHDYIREVLSYNLIFIISKYIRFIKKQEEFPFAIYKKLFQFLQYKTNYVKDFACETFFRISLYNEDLIQNKDKYKYDFIEFVFKNWKVYESSLNNFQIMMIYESLANIIIKIDEQSPKENYFKKLMEKPDLIFKEIINNNNKNINYLNDEKVMKIFRFFIAINERICNSFKKFYWLYGTTIFKEIINIFVYYNEKLNELINNNNNINDGARKKSYELITNSILKYFTCLVKNINDIDIIKKYMILDFGILIDKFNKNPNDNKNPNLLLLFCSIIEIYNNNDYELNYRIWEFFSSNFTNLIKNGNDFPELTENFLKLTKSLVTHSTETFYLKYKSIPKNLIDSLNYGVNSKVPAIYEISLETLYSLIEIIFQISFNGIEQKIIIRQFYDSYFDRIFYFVFGNMIDGFHQNGIKTQIKILRILVGNMDNEDIFGRKIKTDFQQKLIRDLPKIGNNLSSNQIETFTLALFNYSHNEHYFEIIIKDFLVSMNTYNKKEDAISEEEKMYQIRLAREIELKKYLTKSKNYENIAIDNYRDDDFLNLNIFNSH